MSSSTHLVAGCPTVDGFADFSVEAVAVVPNTTVGHIVAADNRMGHEVPHTQTLHAAVWSSGVAAEQAHVFGIGALTISKEAGNDSRHPAAGSFPSLKCMNNKSTVETNKTQNTRE